LHKLFEVLLETGKRCRWHRSWQGQDPEISDIPKSIRLIWILHRWAQNFTPLRSTTWYTKQRSWRQCQTRRYWRRKEDGRSWRWWRRDDEWGRKKRL